MLPRVKRDQTGSTGSLPALGPADEAQLVARCIAGERPAQDELYQRFRRQIANNLYRVLGDRSDLDDLVQEVFVIAFRGLERFRGDPRLTDRPETPEKSLERRQDRARVYRALQVLAPKKQIVLYLHEIEGLDLKEIAYLVESNPVTVRTRLFYARREFYRALAEDAE